MQPEAKHRMFEPGTDTLMEPDETVLCIVKKHWFGLAGIMFASFAGLIALLVIAVVLGVSSTSSIPSSTYDLIMLVGLLVVAVLIFMLVLITYIYRKSNLTITDKSLIEIWQRGLFNKKVSRLSMSNVEDVSVEQSGLLPTALNFGTLTVETAAEEDNFVFALCPNPNHYAQIILEARQNYARPSTGAENA